MVRHELLMRVYELGRLAAASRGILVVTFVCDKYPIVAHSIVVYLVVSVHVADLERVMNLALFEHTSVYCFFKPLYCCIERS